MLPGGTNMIDFDHSISNSSSHESNNLNSDFIGSKRSEDSEEIFKDDELEISKFPFNKLNWNLNLASIFTIKIS